MLNRKMKPIAAAVGTAFVASLATASAVNAEELFTAEEMDKGYDLLAGADQGFADVAPAELAEESQVVRRAHVRG